MTVRSWLFPLLACPRVPTARLQAEALLTVAVANALRQHALEGRLKAVWFHVPNEGKRSPVAGALAKAMGLLPGVHDFAFLWQGGGGLIELKAGKGELSENQRLFHRWTAESGVSQAICRSVAEVEATLAAWGALCPRS